MAVIKIEAKKDTRCMQTICLIRGDRRTQILRFGVNRFDGGVDLSDLTWVIKTANAKGVEDVFEPEAVEIGENRITVDWLVDGSVTDADGMAKYELNGLDATEDGKGIVWKGGMGTMSLRADIGENFADIDMTNIDRLVLYVEGRLQHIIDLTDELQNAGETANAAATAANAGAVRAEAAAIAANTGATAATEAASNASAAAEAANTAALPHAQLYGMRVRGETAKASGNPVTFLPDAGSLLQPVTVLEPQQQGSGDPSPSNIRPFIGYDKLNLGAAGKNLFNLNQAYDSFIDSIITGDVITTTFRSNGALHIKEGDVHPAGAYTLTIVPVSGLESFIAWLYYADNDEEKEIFRFNSTNLSVAFIADRPFKIGFSGIYRNPEHVCSYKVQLEVGSATPYKPHQGKLHTVQLGQTVYGGKFGWLMGKLADDVCLYELNISDMNNEDAYPGWRGVPGLADIVGVGLDTYMNVSGGFVASNISADAVAFGVNTRNGSETLFLSTEYFGMTQSEWKARHPDLKVQLACVRKHPIEIQLAPHIISAADPEQVNTLYGDGRIDAEYVKPLHVSIEERVAAALAAAKE